MFLQQANNKMAFLFMRDLEKGPSTNITTHHGFNCAKDGCDLGFSIGMDCFCLMGVMMFFKFLSINNPQNPPTNEGSLSFCGEKWLQ